MMPANISAMIAASCRRSTVHHHSESGVRCSRESMGGPGRRFAHWSPMMVSKRLTKWKCFERVTASRPSHHRLDAGQRGDEVAERRAADFEIAVLVERRAGRRQQHHGIAETGG